MHRDGEGTLTAALLLPTEQVQSGQTFTIVCPAQQTAELLAKSDQQDTLRVIAFHRARFEMPYPFLDGNGRVGRLLVESQPDASAFGARERPEVPRQEHGGALQTSGRISKLLPLVNFAGSMERIGRESPCLESPRQQFPPFLADGWSVGPRSNRQK